MKHLHDLDIYNPHYPGAAQQLPAAVLPVVFTKAAPSRAGAQPN